MIRNGAPERRDIVLGNRWATATKCRPRGNPGDQQECHAEYDDVKELGESVDDNHAEQGQHGDDRARQRAHTPVGEAQPHSHHTDRNTGHTNKK
jgi:hypothetical protein